MRRLHRLAFLLTPSLLLGQAPPGHSVPHAADGRDTAPTAGAAATRWQVARDALQAGKPDEAIPHLLAALEYHPAAPALLFDLATATAADADATALWRERFVRALSDGQGRSKLEAAWRKALPADELKALQKLCELRAQAAAELAKAAEAKKPDPKGPPGNAIVARQLVEAALAVMDQAAGLQRAQAAALQRAIDQHPVDHERVFAALRRVMAAGQETKNAPTTGPATDPAVRRAQALAAARIAAGLSRQAGFKDLQGPPPPPLGPLAEEAAAVIAAHHALVRQNARVWSIAELEALDPAARVAFTLAHRGEDNPGVALSTTGRYRIETVCGHDTLLGAARTIELHHTRLVAHFGADPFLQQQGVVRIVPGHDDLESDGAPFWWAGGFQAGHVTTVRFAWSSIPALGRILTHELTHRFDGVLRAFAPSWYGEGHAQWTGGHYALMTDPTCVEDWLDRRPMLTALNKGYADRTNFEKLLRGQIDEYRDNYDVGYSLYAFLRGYPPTAPRYREALARWEGNLRAGAKDPVLYFTSVFADGKNGRPRDLDGLLADWQTFLRGIAATFDDRAKPPAWTQQYGDRGPSESEPPVLDEPTLSWERSHHEPFFGQVHAGNAAELLQQAGEPAAAVAAWLWSFSVDGWQRRGAEALPTLLQGLGRADAASALSALAATRWPDLPRVPPLATPLPKTRALLAALQAEVAARDAARQPIAAAALRSDHDRLAAVLGLPAAPTSAATQPPVAFPRLLRHYAESKLAGYDERRVANLWFFTDDGDLHVGRDRQPATTGGVERGSPQRDAFAHTTEWIGPGRYVLRGRVHFTTALVDGALILGHRRRDRGLRIQFHAGDWNYANGRTDKGEGFQKLRVSLAGMWERDGNLPDTAQQWTFDLPQDKAWFDYAIHVTGARVVVTILGEAVLQYTVHDGTPIEGPFGVAMGTGAVRVQQPTLQRLDGTLPLGLDVMRQPGAPLEDLLLQPVTGIPRDDCGTLVLWLPKTEGDTPPDVGLSRALLLLAKMLQEPWDFPQTWVLAVPAGMPQERLAAARAALGEFRKPALPIVEHRVAAPFAAEDPWLLFVDAGGTLRAAAQFGDPKILTRVQKWSRLFRAPGRAAK